MALPSNYGDDVPIVDVAYQPRVSPHRLDALAAALPHAVSLAVECPEEPYDGDLRAGDVELRFHERSSFDSPDLDVLVEVRSKWFASRAEDREARCADLRDALSAAAGPLSIGVFLTLPVAGWAQSLAPEPPRQ